MSSKGWIGVDLDGTLAKYDRWMGHTVIGEPVMPMVSRVKEWLRTGKYDVKIFTARMVEQPEEVTAAIHAWLAKLDIPALEVTNVKDYQMVALWDDRAVRVEHNTGRRVL